MPTIDQHAATSGHDDDLVNEGWPFDTPYGRLAWEAAIHPRPMNPARRRLLSLAENDLEAAKEFYFHLCQMAGLWQRHRQGPGFGFDLEAGAQCLRSRRLLPPGSMAILDAALGHAARFAAGFPLPVYETTMNAIVETDPRRAVAVAYALCRAKDPDEY